MAKLLFRLNGVGDDEADDVRQLLDDHHYDYYETSAGRWGISLAAIWLRNDDDLESARALIDTYQAERGERLRSEYDLARREGRQVTFWQRVRHNPLAALFILAGLVIVLAVSTVPFLRFAGFL